MNSVVRSCIITLFVVLCPMQLPAAVFDVYPGESIQAAIAAAGTGDTVVVHEGVYRERITVTKRRLVLEGKGSAVIDAGGGGTGITVRQPDVTVKNVTVVNYGGDLYRMDAGIRVADYRNRVRLEGVSVSGPGFGIVASYTEDTVIEGCSIRGYPGMHVLDRGDGIYMKYAKRACLKNCFVRDTRDGFYLENTAGTISEKNRFSGTQYGIHYMYTRGDRASDNFVEDSAGGFALMSSKGVSLEDSVVRNTREFGILLNICDGCRAEGNHVVSVSNPGGEPELDTEGKALFVYGPGKSVVRSNRLAASDIGISVSMGGEGVSLENNSIEGNRTQVRYVGEKPLRWNGNYWSTYLGWDADADGVGDRPYQPNDSLDRLFWIYPEARFLMQSPVVALLRLLASRLEIDRGKGVTDMKPLMVSPVKEPQGTMRTGSGAG